MSRSSTYGTSKPRRWLRRHRRLAFGALSFCFALCLCELVLRLFLGNMGSPAFVIEPRDGRMCGLSPSTDTEYTGWSEKVHLVHHDVNAMGYRGMEHSLEEPAGAFRILMIGDSFTYGYGVEANETLPAHLESILTARTGQPVEVLNFGCPGYNLEDSLAQYERFASNWEHDLVLYDLSNNDFDPSVCELVSNRSAEWLLQHCYTCRFVYMLLHPHIVQEDESSAAVMEQRLVQALDGFVETSSRAGAKFAVIELGASTGEILNFSLSHSDNGRQIEVLDISRDCRDLREGVPAMEGEGHFSPEGNRLVANCITDWLMQTD